jgi:diaminohydroxyphosphoribosylaminopyrimidine deaminase/5-amino-6-(5-phosphoribosylamino)uracil reductase
MTLDGKIATRTGDSRWISGEASREIVHRLRGRVDGVMVGRGTAERDDPLLTARPPGRRVATRIVVDSRASLRLDSQLVRSAADAPVLIAAGSEAPQENIDKLMAAGCEVVICRPAGSLSSGERAGVRGSGDPHGSVVLGALLDELGRCRMTNLLVEGGSQLLGALFDAGAIDEVHVFVAPKLIGGATAPSPIAGSGPEQLALALPLVQPEIRQVGHDWHIFGRCQRGG